MPENDIEFIAPLEREITVDGQVVTIRPVDVRAMPRLVRAIEPLLVELMVNGDDGLDVPRIISMLAQYGDGVIEAVAICTRMPVDWVGTRLPDRVAVMALLAVEVNKDFFSRATVSIKDLAPRLAPTLAAAIMANPVSPFPGLTPSTS